MLIAVEKMISYSCFLDGILWALKLTEFGNLAFSLILKRWLLIAVEKMITYCC